MRINRAAVLLAAGIFLSASLISCNRGRSNISEDTVNNVETGPEDEFAVPEGISDGKTFSMYVALSTCKSSYDAEEETGAELHDAVFQRNMLTEEHTGVTLDFAYTNRTSKGTDQEAETNFIRTLIQSGDDTYDAFIHVQHSGMPTLIEEGLFVDWNTIPYINLDNPWWYSNVVRDISYGDKIYTMTGDYNIETFTNTGCLIFNKTMMDELRLEYPYKMVFDGDWTHDKFVEYIKTATSDLNGDGSMNYENDRYGFGGWSWEQIPALFVSYGGEAIKKDENNMPVLNIDNEHTYTVIDKMLEVFDCEGSFYEKKTYGIDDNMFKEGRLLFNDSFLVAVAATRDIENIDIGFVPYPKLNKEQENYYSRTANVSGFTYIPVTNEDLETTGAVLETMAYYSSQTMLPTYFDIILTVKSTRDVESEEMIPIIRNSSRFMEQIINFDGSKIVTAENGNTLSSYIASNKDKWDLKLETLTELYEE